MQEAIEMRARRSRMELMCTYGMEMEYNFAGYRCKPRMVTMVSI